MIVAAAICAAIGLVALGALLALVGANHHPHPEPITPALHVEPIDAPLADWEIAIARPAAPRRLTEDERAWDLQLTGRNNPWPFDQNVD